MGGEFGEPGDEGAADGDRRQQQQGSAEFTDGHPVLEGTDHDLGDEHRLRDDQQRPDGTQADDRHQEEASGAGVPEQSRVDWFHVKHTLFSGGPGFSVGSNGACFT